MNLLPQFREYIRSHELAASGDRWLIAVSGGVDSVVLCYLCREAGIPFSIAHVNFGLRGDESDRDEAHVRQLATALDVPVYVKHFGTAEYAATNRVSVQVAARDLRYGWFTELLQNRDNGLDRVATAHHMDDNVETVLMNFFKGTGISGLTGIQPQRDRIIRPLLFASKTDLLEYAGARGICWVDDSSNEHTDYTRNAIRLRVLPMLRELYPTIGQNIGNNILRWEETEVLYMQAIARHKKDLVTVRDGEAYIPVLKLSKARPLATIIFEIAREYGFTSKQVPELLKLLHSDSGHYIQSPSHRVLRNRAWLIISPLRDDGQQVGVIEEGVAFLPFNGKRFDITPVAAGGLFIPDDPGIAVVDAKHLRYPLLLRRWKTGDYFYPLGMRKKKKLARFFIDRKLSMIDKENVWVLESDKRIVWVLQHRIDDRFKVTDSTTEAVRFSISQPGTRGRH